MDIRCRFDQDVVYQGGWEGVVALDAYLNTLNPVHHGLCKIVSFDYLPQYIVPTYARISLGNNISSYTLKYLMSTRNLNLLANSDQGRMSLSK